MSGRKMDRHRAMAVLYYNYPVDTIRYDLEWAYEMVEVLVSDRRGDKREVCAAHNLVYPPNWWMRAYFDEGLIYPPREKGEAE